MGMRTCITVFLSMLVVWHPAFAGNRIVGSAGVATIEGAAGGGLVPWAPVAGLGSGNQMGAMAFATRVQFPSKYRLDVVGAAIGIHERLEISGAKWSFGLADVAPDKSAEMHVLGVKWSLMGNALYDQASLLPQVSFGAQYKVTEDEELAKQLGARGTDGADFYLSATKYWLGAMAGRNVLGTFVIRKTHANQFGLLGFGGPNGARQAYRGELSVAVMLRDDLVVGGEWRQRPNNLAIDDATQAYKENSAKDIFLAWFPCRGGSITAAWVDLGNIVTKERQRGWYLSGQWNY